MAEPPRKEFAWQRKQREEAEAAAMQGGGDSSGLANNGYANTSAAPGQSAVSGPPAGRKEFAWERKAREQAAAAAAAQGSGTGGPTAPPPISTNAPPQREFAWQRRAREEAAAAGAGGGAIASPTTPATPQKEFAWQRRAREEAAAANASAAQRRGFGWEKNGTTTQQRVVNPLAMFGSSKLVIFGELFRFVFLVAELTCLIVAVNKLGGKLEPRKDEVWVYTTLSWALGVQLILLVGFAKLRRDAREIKNVFVLSLLFDLMSAAGFLGAFIWVSKSLSTGKEQYRADHPKTDANKDTWNDYQTSGLDSWKFNMMLWQFIINSFVFLFFDTFFTCWGIRKGKILRGEVVV